MPEKTDTFIAELGFTPETLKAHSRKTRTFGIVFIILGLAAILLPSVFTVGFELVLGALLLLGGLLQIINALGFSKHRGVAFPLIAGILSTVLGGLFLINPFEGAAILTILLAALFLVNGVLRIIQGVQLKKVPGTGWGILNGVFGIIIAGLVWSAWPTSAVWFIGLLLGIDFLVLGMFLISFASACRREAGN